MARIVKTARGEMVDFDAILIKQQLAQAPMNVDVQRRKDFIDTKEGRARGQRRPVVQAQPAPQEAVQEESAKQIVELDEAPQLVKKSSKQG